MLFLIACSSPAPKNKEDGWVSLFNGKDLDGWDIKISGYELNNNYNNTFRVDDGLLRVSYDQYDKFNGEFGHIFYKTPYSYYKLLVEYRFTGEQTPGGPSWGFRNSGVMLHAQSAATMGLNQDFPVSIEGQFLGGDGISERHTSNVCTPGTNIEMNGQLVTQHCTESTSKTYNGDIWVKAEFVVMGDSVIHHILDGDTVLTYMHPQVGGNAIPEGFPLPEGTLLKKGYICLQAESHPVEFRKVEILDLSKDKR
ncbi:MAG: DUF1080 domain-containing protein [Bacteroidales bacterium]|nr:DUF1080 domain-containing protein [Bacteroidales bacterium]MBK8883330.1 DUF1080 domain-containing protein [Bacteroidales bacterium]